MKKKYFIIVGAMLLLASIFVIGIINHESIQKYSPIPERNYQIEALLGVTPNMESRQPTQKDIDTQLNFKTTEGQVYRLFESRDFLTYGKTFVVRIK